MHASPLESCRGRETQHRQARAGRTACRHVSGQAGIELDSRRPVDPFPRWSTSPDRPRRRRAVCSVSRLQRQVGLGRQLGHDPGRQHDSIPRSRRCGAAERRATVPSVAQMGRGCPGSRDARVRRHGSISRRPGRRRAAARRSLLKLVEGLHRVPARRPEAGDQGGVAAGLS